VFLELCGIHGRRHVNGEKVDSGRQLRLLEGLDARGNAERAELEDAAGLRRGVAQYLAGTLEIREARVGVLPELPVADQLL
jgi:hypothetical protein